MGFNQGMRLRIEERAVMVKCRSVLKTRPSATRPHSPHHVMLGPGEDETLSPPAWGRTWVGPQGQ